MIRLTALMDNLPSENKSLIAEHGLAIWVETDDTRFLFDCSASESAIKNAHRLGIDLATADFTICSHSHYDHAAGYRDLVESGLAADTLFTGPDFFEKKYAFDGTRYTDLSCGYTADFLAEHVIKHSIVRGLDSPAPGCWLIGDFPRTHAFETIPPRFVKGDLAAPVTDDFGDEICLALETQNGVAVLLGCSHPGILNMLHKVQVTLNKPICAVFGGSHLVEADEARIAATITEMKAMGVKSIGLSHCSGQRVEEYLHTDHCLHSCHMAVGDCMVL